MVDCDEDGIMLCIWDALSLVMEEYCGESRFLEPWLRPQTSVFLLYPS